MNYEKIYYQIIENRINSPLSDNEYGENHHILPKSLGGTDANSNLIKLTAREHYICHALLAEMYEIQTNEWYKMNHAFLMMQCSTTKQNRYFNSKLYELKRNDFSKVMSFNQLGNKNSQFGTIWINDGTIDKKIQKTSIIPNGWVAGRIKKKKEKKDSNIYFNELIINKYRQNKILEIFKIIPTEDGIKTLNKKLHHLYVIERLSTNQIASLYGTNNETIRNYLKLFNIKCRTVKASQLNYYNK